VIHATDTEADIQIIQMSACASCHIRSLCTGSDTSAKTIHAVHAGDLKQGMRAEISMKERYGWLGVLVAFVLPLVIVVGALFGLAPVFGSQELAALAGLGALAPYYLLLYGTRGWFARVVRFEATPAAPTVTMTPTIPLNEEGLQ
jgi:sigma-E factor negative regulatory protein RseC